MLVRNIDKEVMIEVKNLVMEFKVSKDKIDTLKEYIIRTIKRNKTEKQKVRILDDISFKVYKGEKSILGAKLIKSNCNYVLYHKDSESDKSAKSVVEDYSSNSARKASARLAVVNG